MRRTMITLTLVGTCAMTQAGTLAGVPLPEQTQSQEDTSAQPVNPVVQWNRTLLAIIRTPKAQPATVHGTRSLAIMHAAIYDAVNASERRHKPYAVRLLDVSPSASQDAAAAAAAHDVLAALYPSFH